MSAKSLTFSKGSAETVSVAEVYQRLRDTTLRHWITSFRC